MSATTEDSQAANPTIYAALGAQAAYQVEALAIAMRDFAVAQRAELDTFVITSTIRLQQLAGALMALSQGKGTAEEAVTVWGDTIDSFAASLPDALLEQPTS